MLRAEQRLGGGRDTRSRRLGTGTISPGLSKTVLLRWNLNIVTFFHLEHTVTFNKCTELCNRHPIQLETVPSPQRPLTPAQCFRAGQAVCFPSRSRLLRASHRQAQATRSFRRLASWTPGFRGSPVLRQVFHCPRGCRRSHARAALPWPRDTRASASLAVRTVTPLGPPFLLQPFPSPPALQRHLQRHWDSPSVSSCLPVSPVLPPFMLHPTRNSLSTSTNSTPHIPRVLPS